MSDSLQPPRLLCPWDSPGKNTGLGWHFLLQGISPTQESYPGLLHCRLGLASRLTSEEMLRTITIQITRRMIIPSCRGQHSIASKGYQDLGHGLGCKSECGHLIQQALAAGRRPVRSPRPQTEPELGMRKTEEKSGIAGSRRDVRTTV